MRTLHFSRSITITFTNHKIELDYEYDYTKELYSIASYRLRLQSYTPLIFTAKDSDQGYIELLYIYIPDSDSVRVLKPTSYWGVQSKNGWCQYIKCVSADPIHANNTQFELQ